MKLAFMGSPGFAVPALQSLCNAGHEIAVVYCQPPRPTGRGQRMTKCAVHSAADGLGIPVRTPARLRGNTQEIDHLGSLGLDCGIVAAYGLILPKPVLEAPLHGCLNIHASLLPRWRGAAPIQAAILAGDTQTGITIMQMDEGLDTGPLISQEPIVIGPRETAVSLLDRLAEQGAAAIVRALERSRPAKPQPTEGVTYAAKLSRADAVIDWHQDARAIERRIRALTPWPGTETTLTGRTLKIVDADVVLVSGEPGVVMDTAFTIGCGSHGLRPKLLKRAGGPVLSTTAFLNGHAVPAGTRLG